MRRLALTVAVAATLAVSARADRTVTVDPARQGQTLEGWGTSLCWFANVIGGYPDKVRADYVARIFDPRRGLGLNIARYNIGGGEDPDIPDTLQPRARIPGFEPAPGVWDWDADANQRRILLEARQRDVNLVEAFSNSPPYWMTLSGSVTGAPDGGSNLKPQDYDAFADYLAAVVRHYHDAWGVTFRTLEPMNESADYWWKKGGHQEGCHFDARNAQGDDQNALVKKVAAALARRDLSTVVSASDDNGIDTTLASVGSYDARAQGAIGQINTHTYWGSARVPLHQLAQRLGKRVWVSEHGDGDATGLSMSRDILGAFNQMGATAWVYWQAVDGGGWGLLSKNLNKTGDFGYALNEKYWVLAQYSRFIRPGFRLVGVDDDNSLVAYLPAKGTLVIVTTNSGPAAAQVTYDLSRFRHLPPTARAYRTSATESLAELPAMPVIAGRIHAPAPADSVTTYVLTKIF